MQERACDRWGTETTAIDIAEQNSEVTVSPPGGGGDFKGGPRVWRFCARLKNTMKGNREHCIRVEEKRVACGGGGVVGAPFLDQLPPLQGSGDGGRADHPKGPWAAGCVGEGGAN